MLLIVASLWLLAPAHTAAETLQAEPPAASADAVVFDRASGYYTTPFDLVISTTAKDATLGYTTNGAVPRPGNALRHTETLRIATTTIVRAAAFGRDPAPLGTGTRTFLFLSAIPAQTAAALPKTWGTNGNQPIPAHYGMSPAGAKDEAARQKLLAGLEALPVLSIVTDPDHLYSAATGLYLHPGERGAAWERPVALELFHTAGRSGFQTVCGLRIHGSTSRNPEESPKHSFRLIFQPRSGGPLRIPLFGADGAQEFTELVLRAGNNDSWLDSNGKQRRRATYIRDEWMRRSLQAMGHPSARGRFVHLYLNGLYWGLYNLCERPGPALPAASPAGAGAGFDVRKADKTESGDDLAWSKVLALANAGLADERNYEALGRLLDLPQLADYLILNFYAGNTDWDRSANWFAIRPRTPDGRFRFLVWDAEGTLADAEASTLDFDDDESPPRLFHQLSEQAAFRKLFAARARRLLFGNGPLAPEPAAERYRDLAKTVAPALTAEAARWGSYRRDVHPYKTGPYEGCTVEEHWQPEVDRVLAGYFTQRRDVLLNQFRERGLFPPVNAPEQD